MKRTELLKLVVSIDMTTKRHKVRIIADPSFKDKGSLTNNEFKRLAVNSFEGAAAAFVEDFDNDPIGLVGMQLAADNCAIENACFLTQGFLFKEPKVINGNSWFDVEESISIKLFPLDCGKFVFGNSLTSSLLDSSEIEHKIRYKGVSFKGINYGFHSFSTKKKGKEDLFSSNTSPNNHNRT